MKYLALLLCILLVTAEHLQYELYTIDSRAIPIHSLSTLLLSATSGPFELFVPISLLLAPSQLLSPQAFDHFRPAQIKDVIQTLLSILAITINININIMSDTNTAQTEASKPSLVAEHLNVCVFIVIFESIERS